MLFGRFGTIKPPHPPHAIQPPIFASFAFIMPPPPPPPNVLRICALESQKFSRETRSVCWQFCNENLFCVVSLDMK